MPDAAALDRKRELARERQRRWRQRVDAHQTCVVVQVGEGALQALICAGHLAEDAAHLKAEIAHAAQSFFDRVTAEELRKVGYL